MLLLLCLACDKYSTIHITGKTMGTTYSITIVDKVNIINDRLAIKTQIDSLLYIINQRFSTYISKSEINIFNAYESKSTFQISPDFFEIIEKSLEVYELSEGSFDITIYPIFDAWGFSLDYNTTMVPDSFIIEKLLKHTGSDQLVLNKPYLSKNDSLLKIDVSGIAKGWGVDKVGELLNSLGLYDYLIEIGGEMLVVGENKENKKWEVGIRFPNKTDFNLYSSIFLKNKAIATSGTYQNYFTIDSINYSHLINPKTGYPIQHELISATIIADDCVTADAIATAVMVKGFANGLNWINSMDNIEGLLIGINKEGDYFHEQSKGFKFN